MPGFTAKDQRHFALLYRWDENPQPESHLLIPPVYSHSKIKQGHLPACLDGEGGDAWELGTHH